jgi:chromosome segregation ATPase
VALGADYWLHIRRIPALMMAPSMKPAPPETAELLHRVRQQLILAQVRIMELEDVRDELLPKLAEAESLVAAAQSLADQKMEEADHLAKTLSDLQAQHEHLRHMQHITNEALNETRRQLTGATEALATAGKASSRLQEQLAVEAVNAARQSAEAARLGADLATSTAALAERLQQVNAAHEAMRILKSSRSWRWTAWLRAVERTLKRKP